MYAVIRMRGSVHVRDSIEDTLDMLRLNKVNHCVLIEDTPSNRGMIQKVKDYVAYGQVDADSLSQMLAKRGRLQGGLRLTDEYVSENTGFDSIEAFADSLVKGEAKIGDVPKLKPVFRLHPPRKGHAGMKRTYQQGGVLGNHGDQITVLLNKMR